MKGHHNEELKRSIYATEFLVLNKDRVITAAILVGLFGGLVGGPITSLVYYDAPAEERFKLFIIPELIGFICMGLMIYYGKTKSKD